MSVVVSMRERRAAVRVDLQLAGYVSEIACEGAYKGDEEVLIPLYGRIVNLSSTGLLIETGEPICPGREVRVIARHNGSKLALSGYVVRVAYGFGEHRALLAVELFDLPGHEEEVLARLVDAHRPDPGLN